LRAGGVVEEIERSGRVAGRRRARLHMLRCLATGAHGAGGWRGDGRGVDLKLRRSLSTMPEWFSMAVDSQPEMAQKSRSSENARVLQVVLPGGRSTSCRARAQSCSVAGKALRKPQRSRKLVISRKNLLVIAQVVALVGRPGRRGRWPWRGEAGGASASVVGVARLHSHRTRRGPCARASGRKSWAIYRTRRTTGRGRLMLIPPAAPLLLVGAVQLWIVRLKPGLRGLARRRDEAVVGGRCSGWVFGAHGFEDGDGVGIVEVGADLVLQAVLDDRGVGSGRPSPSRRTW